MAWIDIVFIAIIVIFAIVGLVKGLFDSILSLVASVASIFLAFWAGKPVAEFLNKMVGLNSFFEKALTSIGISESGLANHSLQELASVCSLVLSMLIVFILIKVAVWLLAKLFDSVTANSTALSGMNRLLGLVFGAVKGFAIVLIVLGLTAVVSIYVTPVGTKVNNFLENSSITMKTYNYIEEWVDNDLRDKIDDFIHDLAKDAPKDEEESETTNYAEQAYTQLNNKDITTNVTDDGITYTLETTVNFGENIDVVISWPDGGKYKLSTDVDSEGTLVGITSNAFSISGLGNGTYNVTFRQVTFTLSGSETDTVTRDVVFTFTIDVTTPVDPVE